MGTRLGGRDPCSSFQKNGPDYVKSWDNQSLSRKNAHGPIGIFRDYVKTGDCPLRSDRKIVARWKKNTSDHFITPDNIKGGTFSYDLFFKGG